MTSLTRIPLDIKPVFTSIGSIDLSELAACSWAHYSSKAVEEGGIYFSDEAHKEFQKRNIQPLSQKELDVFVKKIAKREGFAWERGEDGCYARAALIAQYLIVMGFPTDKIDKVYLCAPKNRDQRFNLEWNYHTAVRVESREGVQLIIDPHTNSQRALSLQEWIAVQSPIAQCANLGVISHPISLSKRKWLVCSTNKDLQLTSPSGKKKKLQIIPVDLTSSFFILRELSLNL